MRVDLYAYKESKKIAIKGYGFYSLLMALIGKEGWDN